MKTIYIAGSMTGFGEFNFPAFNAAEVELRAKEYEVKNPARMFSHTHQAYEFYLRAALQLMLTCEEVYFLQGWEHSVGARLEHKVAFGVGMKLHYQEEKGNA